MKRLLGVLCLLVSAFTFSSVNFEANNDLSRVMNHPRYKENYKQWLIIFNEISSPNSRNLLLDNPLSVIDNRIPECVKVPLIRARGIKKSVQLNNAILPYSHKMNFLSEAARFENDAYAQYKAYLQNDLCILNNQITDLFSSVKINHSRTSSSLTDQTTNISDLSTLTSHISLTSNTHSAGSSIMSDDLDGETDSVGSSILTDKNSLKSLLYTKLRINKANELFLASQKQYAKKLIDAAELEAIDLVKKQEIQDEKYRVHQYLLARVNQAKETVQDAKRKATQQELKILARRTIKKLAKQEKMAMPAITKFQAIVRGSRVRNDLAEIQRTLLYEKEKFEESKRLAEKIAREQEEQLRLERLEAQRKDDRAKKALKQLNQKQLKKSDKVDYFNQNEENELLNKLTQDNQQILEVLKKQKEDAKKLKLEVERDEKRKQIELALKQAKLQQEKDSQKILSESIFNSLVTIVNGGKHLIDTTGLITQQTEDNLYAKIQQSMEQHGIIEELVIRTAIIKPAINYLKESFLEVVVHCPKYDHELITLNFIEPVACSWIDDFKKYKPDYSQEQLDYCKMTFQTILTQALELQYKIYEAQNN
jgi:hypothetical protein